MRELDRDGNNIRSFPRKRESRKLGSGSPLAAPARPRREASGEHPARRLVGGRAGRSLRSPARRGRAEVFVAALAAILLSASPAAADLEICNRTSFVVETALGIEDQGVSATRGWFRVDPGDCHTVLRGDATFDKIYVHARTLPVYGQIRPLLPGETRLCVSEGDFLIPGAQRCGPKQRLVAFGRMQPSDSDNGKAVYIAEPAAYGPDQARLAAVQRLLVLAGLNAEPIDGVPGPRTEAALAQFLRERGLPPAAGEAADLIDTLVAAMRDGAAPGLLWCNETSHPVMAALGVEQDTSIVARGWWRVEPGACLRPDLPRRAGRVYSFAEAVDANGAVVQRKGMPLAWGGGKRLCVRNSRFEIDEHTDCAARGLTAQGFNAVELQQGAGATLRFREP